MQRLGKTAIVWTAVILMAADPARACWFRLGLRARCCNPCVAVECRPAQESTCEASCDQSNSDQPTPATPTPAAADNAPEVPEQLPATHNETPRPLRTEEPPTAPATPAAPVTAPAPVTPAPATPAPVTPPAPKPSAAPAPMPAPAATPAPTKPATPPAPAKPAPAAKPAPVEPADEAPDSELETLFNDADTEPAADMPADDMPADDMPEPAEPSDAVDSDKPAAAEDDVDALFDKSSAIQPAAEPVAEAIPNQAAHPSDDLTEASEAVASSELDSEPQLPDSESPMRWWSDNTGKFRVRAKLVSVGDKTVRLLKESGRYTTVPVNRLSGEDLAFVRQQAPSLVAGK